jgi:glycosyltransferase involved in cell wall biosynthesis
MIIGIDASRAEAKLKTGVERYSFEIIRAMRVSLPPSAEVVLYSYRPLPKELGPFNNRWKNKVLSWPPKYLWTAIRLSWEMWRRPPDVLFVPGYRLPFIVPKRSVVTIHDASFLEYPELYTPSDLRTQKAALVDTCKRASTVIVPSEYTKTQLAALKPANIAVIPLGVRIDEKTTHSILSYDKREDVCGQQEEMSTSPPKIRGSGGCYGLKENYFIFIGRVDKKKNLGMAIEAFSKFSFTHPGYKFLIIGRPSFGFDEIKFQAQKSGAADRIEFMGSLPDKKMFVLLKNAVALVHPCPIEGFGLPVVEAMSLGVPVITTDQGAAAEAVGDAALLVRPTDSDKWSQAMDQVTFDIFRKSLIEKGLERSKHFVWSLAAEATWKKIV